MARKFIFITRSYCSNDVFSMVPVSIIPALLTRTSSFLCAPIVCSHTFFVSPSLEISPTARCGVHLLTAAHCSATSFKFSTLRPFKASVAPNFANFTAAAAPIPELAPDSIIKLI
uniref:Uncharacterized protein n=1 Tax=Glossina pallidipes TaxID=7398 RepID=A0A1A9ZDI4_GLOPL